MNLRHELFAHGDSERLEPELNETTMLIKRLGGGISVRDCKLHDLNAATTLGVLKRCQDKLAADATVPEFGRHIHAE